MADLKWIMQEPWECDRIEKAIRDEGKAAQEGIWEYSIKYILMTLLCKLFHIKTSEKQQRAFRVQAYELCRKLAKGDYALEKAYCGGLDRMWQKLSEQIQEPGFYHFVMKYGMESAFLLTYFSVLSPHSPALEAARGFSVDLAGRYREIPESDWQAYALCKGEPTFRSFGSRVYWAQSWMLRAVLDSKPEMYVGAAEEPAKPNVFFAAAGMMPEVRYYRLKPEMLKDYFGQIVAYDNDPNMPRYLDMVFEKLVCDYGIDYHFGSIEKAFEVPELQGKFDVVVANGFMSYHKDEAETLYYLRGFHKLLKPGGSLVFDVQTMEPSMIRCAVTLAWKLPLKPDASPKAAIKRIRTAATRANFESCGYSVDNYNKIPALVNFRLKKPDRM